MRQPATDPGTLSARRLVPGGTGQTPLRQAQGRGHSLCTTAPFVESREGSQEGTFVCLLQRASAFQCGTEAPGSPSAALFSQNPTSCSAQASPGISCAGKLESDPWHWAWSPWQLRVYYRGLHPAWRTFDLKQRGRKPRKQSWEQRALGCSWRPQDGKRGSVSPAR